MRLRQRDLKPYTIAKNEYGAQSDGTTYDEWGRTGIIYANVQPAGGKLLIELYGARLTYMKIAYVENAEIVTEGDGVYIDNTEIYDTPPDYKVIAIRRWGDHFVLDLEKLAVKHDYPGIEQPHPEIERTWRQ